MLKCIQGASAHSAGPAFWDCWFVVGGFVGLWLVALLLFGILFTTTDLAWVLCGEEMAPLSIKKTFKIRMRKRDRKKHEQS